MNGPGRYQDAAAVARLVAGARSVVLLVFDGILGTGFEVIATREVLEQLPRVLRQVAGDIEADVHNLSGTGEQPGSVALPAVDGPAPEQPTTKKAENEPRKETTV